MKKFFNMSKKAALSAVCAAEVLVMTACASNNSSLAEQITLAQAEEIALSDAGLTASDVITIKTKQDTENGVSIYDITFSSKYTRYEYEVKADTGNIYSKSIETLTSQENVPDEVVQNVNSQDETQIDSNLSSQVQQDTIQQNVTQQNETQQNATQQNTTQQGSAQQNATQQNTTQQGSAQQNAAQQNTTQQNTTQQNTELPSTTQQNQVQPTPSSNGQISVDAAKNAALTDAGLSSSEVVFTKEKLDYEDGIAVYDIEFYTNTMEYEYEINATTGAVYSKDVETLHTGTGHGGHTTQTSGNYIGDDSAKSIALNHAGFSAADVTRLKSEFDIDDGQAVYEVEFYKDGREYEYTISAADGFIIEYDVD